MKRLLCVLLCAGTGACVPRGPADAPVVPRATAPSPEARPPEENVKGRPVRIDARAEAARIGDPEKRMEAHERLLAVALAEDPRKAVAWLLGLEDKAMAAVLLDQALAAWAEVDAPAAGAHVAALPESDYQAMLAGELAAAWAVRDGPAATAWAAGLGDQEAREEALRGALGRVAENDPRAAAELALRATGDGDRAAAVERVVERWWERDATAVEAWARGLTEARGKELAERLVAARREAEVR
jgi:hypothetical protein